jgi:XapX domain-containing protein
MRILIGFVLAFTVGAVCRATGIPLPAPPVLLGALVVLAMSAGYIATDRLVHDRAARHRDLCGGPTGATARDSEGPS